MNLKIRWQTPLVFDLNVTATSSNDPCGTGLNTNKPSPNSDGAGSTCS